MMLKRTFISYIFTFSRTTLTALGFIAMKTNLKAKKNKQFYFTSLKRGKWAKNKANWIWPAEQNMYWQWDGFVYIQIQTIFIPQS